MCLYLRKILLRFQTLKSNQVKSKIKFEFKPLEYNAF